MCLDCHRVEAKDFWKSAVQVRQKSTKKGTFYYLEQVILKYEMHKNTSKISTQPNGLDFFYALDQDARKMTEFLTRILPCRYEKSQKLISHDVHNSSYNYKISYSVELPGICKNDIICLPRKLAQQLGNLGQFVVCLRVTNCIHLIDVKTLQTAKVAGNVYWRNPFYAACDSASLSHFTVMEVEMNNNRPIKSGEGNISKKHALADCWVIKTSEIGLHEDFIHVRTHLGHLLKIGDSVLGLDVKNANINDSEMSKISEYDLPDVILVKKVYDRQKRRRQRKWRLKRMANRTASVSTDDDNYNQFLEDLEEDQEMRQNIDIYIDGADATQCNNDDGNEEFPTVSLSEMIQDLKIDNDVEMEEEIS